MKKQLNNTRGETIVEIVVSFLLLMLFTAVFVAALRYAQTMRLKTEQLREAAYRLCDQVYPLDGGMDQGTIASDATGDYSFRAPSYGTFTVKKVTLYEKETTYTDTTTGATSTYTFHTYGKEAATP